MNTRLAAAALAVFVAVAAAGCGQSTAPVAKDARPPAIGVEQLRADGIASLERGAYDAALRAFVEALSRLPEDVGLHYLLGVTFSHLDRREDAILAFRWVVEHGKPGTAEVEGATRWLAGIGVAVAKAEVTKGADAPDPEATVFEGRAEWKDWDPERGSPRLQLMLDGMGTSTQGRRYGIQSELNGPFKFPKVHPGEYRLRAQVGMTKLWDVRVTIGDKTTIELNQDNAISRDALNFKS